MAVPTVCARGPVTRAHLCAPHAHRSPIRTEYKVAFPYLYNNRPRKVSAAGVAPSPGPCTRHALGPVPHPLC
jgi:hypothetical protein